MRRFNSIVAKGAPDGTRPLFTNYSVPFIGVPSLRNAVFMRQAKRVLSRGKTTSRTGGAIPTKSVYIDYVNAVKLMTIAAHTYRAGRRVGAIVPRATGRARFLCCSLLCTGSGLIGLNSGNTAVKGIGGQGFNRVELIYPPRSLVGRFRRHASPTLTLIDALRIDGLHLSTTQSLLLPHLVSNRLSIVRTNQRLGIT